MLYIYLSNFFWLNLKITKVVNIKKPYSFTNKHGDEERKKVYTTNALVTAIELICA